MILGEASYRTVLRGIEAACDRDALARAGGSVLRYIRDETILRDCGQSTTCRTPPGCARHWEERNRELVEERDKMIEHSKNLANARECISLASDEQHSADRGHIVYSIRHDAELRDQSPCKLCCGCSRHVYASIRRRARHVDVRVLTRIKSAGMPWTRYEMRGEYVPRYTQSRVP